MLKWNHLSSGDARRCSPRPWPVFPTLDGKLVANLAREKEAGESGPHSHSFSSECVIFTPSHSFQQFQEDGPLLLIKSARKCVWAKHETLRLHRLAEYCYRTCRVQIRQQWVCGSCSIYYTQSWHLDDSILTYNTWICHSRRCLIVQYLCVYRINVSSANASYSSVSFAGSSQKVTV